VNEEPTDAELRALGYTPSRKLTETKWEYSVARMGWIIQHPSGARGFIPDLAHSRGLKTKWNRDELARYCEEPIRGTVHDF